MTYEVDGRCRNGPDRDRLTIRNFVPEDWPGLLETAIKYQASKYAQYDHKWPTDEEGVQGMANWFSSGPEGAGEPIEIETLSFKLT